ncbi:hypothetical protein CH063_09954 [Colletotrichum higginsianum]|uniref:Uncharacterized protein n=1 Tax=Colletotrichum higginsianum (strain IMI 349063) TaxID=759273 RepID=H1VFK5_COLHI|nr:hypothetical protein CH63R_03874 [Colletotrichum higginsianum IMI 349063]OBR11578.1 hypothetical protein CH63R_03874 [Colletotrichum higginsianum IMI 349063]CCF39008.1 hypothetical protein CH063_09954 [Colletotrichum higginsianum]
MPLSGSPSGSSSGPSNPDTRSLERKIRDDLCILSNTASVPWIQFEVTTLGALAELNNEFAQAWGAQMRKDEEDAMDIDGQGDANGGESNNNDDDDDEDDDQGNINVNIDDDNDNNNDNDAPAAAEAAEAAEAAKRTRTRHIKDKHPNQPVPPFNDP